MKKYILIVCIALFSFIDGMAQAPVKQVEWLQGSWKGMYKNAPFYEAWRRVTDSVMVNFVIEVKGTDTVVKENGAILLMSRRRGYAGTDALWEFEALTDKKIILKNDTLKYANRIIWEHSSNDHWLTEIQGPTGLTHYDMERVIWPEAIVDRFIRNARRQ